MLKIKNVSFKEKKKRTGTWKLLRKLASPKFLLLHKKSELPKIWEGEGGLAAPSSPGPCAHGCYDLFLQSNTFKFQVNFILFRRVWSKREYRGIVADQLETVCVEQSA